MAIGATIYKVGIDTSQFVAGSTLTRAELKLTKQILKETATETEKYGAVVGKVNNLVDKQAISVQAANIVLGQARAEQLRGIPVVGNYVSGLYSMGPAAAAAAVATAGVALAVRNVSDQMEKLDTLIASADTLGIAAGQFQRLQNAAEFADISNSQFSSGMKTMETQVAKAAAGMEKARKGFDIIELDAKKLMDLRPEQAFLQIVDALAKVDNAFKRARAASAIFGSEEFGKINTAMIERATKNIEAMGGGLEEHGIKKFDELDDVTKDLQQSWDLMWKKFTVETAPEQKAALELIIPMIRGLRDLKAAMIDIVQDLAIKDGYAGLGGGLIGAATDIAAAVAESSRGKGQRATDDRGGSAIKDIVEEVSDKEDKVTKDAYHRKQQLHMAGLKTEMETRERNTEAEFKKREKMEHDLAETRKILWDEGVKEFESAHKKMFADMAKAEREEDRAREIVEDMEIDRKKRRPEPTTEVLRLGSRGALEAVARANRAPTIVSAPEMTRAQREAVELLRKIEAKEPIMVVEESL